MTVATPPETGPDAIATIEAAKSSGIRFIQLQFTDIIGHVKAVTIPIHQLESSVKHGTWFDGSSIGLHPDRRIGPVPDARHGHVRRDPVAAGVRGAGHGARDLRRVHAARRAVRRRPALRAAPPGGAGAHARLRGEHRSGAGVLPVPARRGRRDRAAGPRPGRLLRLRPILPRRSARTWWTRSRRSGSGEAAHHEVAVGQHEIDFEYSDALRTADNAVTFKFAPKAIAQQHGLYATFMPKPIHGINGSGMHTHQSLYSIAESRNACSPTRTTRTGCPTSHACTWPDPRPRARHDRGARSARELTSGSCPVTRRRPT